MIQPAFEILNQRGTPMFFSDVFANRPTAGVVGRIFISTDTYAFYRDTGTGWDLIGGPGTGTITGSGTANKITKFTGTTSIGDSIMTEGTGLITLTGSNSRFVVGGTDDGSSQLQTYYDGNTRWKFVAASDTPTDDADITGYKSRGTIAFPTAIQSGDSITNYSGRGHNGTTFVGGGGFDIFAAENYSVGNNGSYIAVETTPIGSASPTYFHRFSANGGLNVGQNADPTTGYVFQASGNSIVQSGKLVINNASSDSHLQVVGANAPSIRIDNAIVGATQRFVMGLATATNNFIQGSTAGDICISTASASPLLFGMWQTINASEIMRITTSNNLLVGSSVDTGQKLQITGTSRFNGNISTNSNFVDIGTASKQAYFYSDTGSGFALNLSANNLTGTGTSPFGRIFFTNTISGVSNTLALLGAYIDGVSDASQLIFWTKPTGGSATARLVINSLGNLGLGITPSASTIPTLQFGSNAIVTSTNSSYFNANAFYDGAWKYITSTSATQYQQTNGSHAWFTAPSGTAGNAISFTQAMTLTDTGRLGIGTSTPARIFTIFGGALTSRILLQNTTTGSAINNGLDITMDGTNAQFWNYQNGYTAFATNNIEAARISSSQNLLIGLTTDAGYKIDVNGTGRFSSALYANTQIFVNDYVYVSKNTGTNYFIATNALDTDLTISLSISGATNKFASIQPSVSNRALALNKDNGGNVLIGSEIDQGKKLYLNGSLRIDGQLSATAGGSSGQHLIINCDGTTYKIALLNN